MAPSPRKRLLSPRKRLPPTPFNQTWHETDTAHLDPSALPVARIPRGWERKREVTQVSEGKAKSIWRRFNSRSSIINGQQEDETEEEELDAQSRAVKRRQRMSPEAMEKMQGNKRAFKGTRWDRRKSVLPRKRSAHSSEALHEGQSESDDTQDATDADMSHESLAEVPHAHEGPSSFTFAIDTAQTLDELPDYESLDEQDGEQKLGNILPEDSTFALIFRSPVKGSSAPLSTSPAKPDYPALPHSEKGKEQLEASSEQAVGEEVTVTGPTVESAVAAVIANVPTSTTYIPESDAVVRSRDEDGTDTTNTANTAQAEVMAADPTESSSAETLQAQLDDAEELTYPALPTGSTSDDPVGDAQTNDDTRAGDEEEDDDAEMSEVDLGTFTASAKPANNDTAETVEDESADEEVTEASLQLDIQGEYEREGELASQPPTPKPAEKGAHNIADGLILTPIPAKAHSKEHTPKTLRSPPPPLRIESGPDDATVTLAIDDDTAILKSFLSRAAASKAERSAIITRRSSLENRRDSDIVRHALASPRKALEEKDPNSPSKTDSEATFDLSETPVLSPEIEESASPTLEQPEAKDTAEAKTGQGSRRSSRAKKSRLPAPATTTQPQASNKIAIRRADGTDPVVLKKTDAQELALITKNNTRKNKQGAFMVSLRLLKLQAEAILSPTADMVADAEKPPAPGRRGIRWDETLAYYQEHADTIAAQQVEAESLATPDELSLPALTATKKPKAKTSIDKNLTPKIRRVRGLGTANGTPGKGLLATGSLLPDAVQEEKSAAQPAPTKGIPKPKATKKLPVPSTPTDSKLAALEVAPVGVEPIKERKSRLAPPKSVRLPKPVANAVLVKAEEKENTSTGVSGATPRKGIPAPRVVAPKSVAASAPAVRVESGLPRRRGRKV
ncbi:hypothetical protein BU25DRAFT_490430 [Macroventuria anomochaeta]|uniref:Uncharacterized protein n=1 Tax=Macroventuria anomochaeta TaxID=301207 RepID=A0ACB6S3K0_9PLEO|nr:uncharacterized protein BU25DRAFT_490430 [Macroventuria anomochaeta]KAF2628815.1 hypothetical protein BU25DRAFT_490430 [Macroventuria anomochaeta]